MVLPYMGSIGTCSPTGIYGFLAVLVRIEVPILAILVSKTILFLHSSS